LGFGVLLARTSSGFSKLRDLCLPSVPLKWRGSFSHVRDVAGVPSLGESASMRIRSPRLHWLRPATAARCKNAASREVARLAVPWPTFEANFDLCRRAIGFC